MVFLVRDPGGFGLERPSRLRELSAGGEPTVELTSSRTITRLIDGAQDFRLLPSGREAMVQLVSTDAAAVESGSDWVRVPIPVK